ncbi:glycerophosphodiester phosphodiesterase [Deinococcus radiophilus]|uniref:glycerophosphodiester phosphodiesterase n=1 Tax=Deinococcus radiophilus TaxID=32062 RepID=UPI001E2F8078|nr:glycerophosphodiester phosphodiesterase [Deinococcus radiophilus]UFA50742.1 glycerophosphodiester phosphodiesterase [Deinococcus radiophilus]
MAGLTVVLSLLGSAQAELLGGGGVPTAPIAAPIQVPAAPPVPAPAPAVQWQTLSGAAPLVIGHRGSSGTRPEHTLEAYREAIRGGADFIEPDLVVTKDGVLVARHEPVIAIVDPSGKVLEATADVHNRSEFRDRLTVKQVDGHTVRGYFVEDFTLAELKTLRALERLPQQRSTQYDGLFEIPTLSEVIALVREEEARTGRQIGIYPETKHPTYMQAVAGVNTSQLLIDTLVREEFTDPQRVFIQSFETANLRDLNTRIMPAAGVDLPLIQLISGPDEAPYDWTAAGDTRTYAALGSSEGLRDIATYADGVGPYKRWVIDDHCQTTDFVTRAHAAGLPLHPWTFRNEASYLLSCYGGDPKAEMRQAIAAGVDGLFTDFPATGREVVDALSR